MVTLTIDGKVITAQPNTTILEAALGAGISIPHLCYHPKLFPIGSCRLCVVEIEGVNEPMASCNTPVKEGIRVTTTTPLLERLRKQALQYILLNHPLECPICDKAGECQLQDLCHAFGITEQLFAIETPSFHTDYSSPLIEKHDARCVMCGRCVSVCTEVQGVHALDFVHNGYQSRIAPVSRNSLDCEFCGQCVAVCPVGAFIDKLFKYKARVWQLTKVSSVCPYCGSGCGIELNVKDNRIVRVTSDEKTTANRGNLCIRGRFGYGFVHNQNRLQSPFLMQHGKLVPASLHAVLDFAADAFKTIISAYGPDSIAGLGSPHASNEDNYVFQKFFRVVLGTNNVDSIARFNLLRGIVSMNHSIGFPASTNSYQEIERSQSIFIIGSDFSAEMPVASLPIIRAARDNDARLIIAYPLHTKFDAFATTRLHYRPQSELMLLAGLIKAILECGLENSPFIQQYTENFDRMKETFSGVALDAVASHTGIPVALIEKAAREIAQPATGAVICGDSLLRELDGEQAVRAVCNILLLTGHIGREGCGCFFSTARNNLQGLCDMGVTADLLPGYRSLSDNNELTNLWHRNIPVTPGVNATELIAAIEQGKIKGLYLMGCDPLMSFPDAKRTRAALSKLEFLLVQDLFHTEAAQMAHAVIPVASFAEKEGSVTSGERRIQWMQKACEPLPGVLPDWRIVQELSQRFAEPMDYRSTWDIFQEIETAVPQYRGAHQAVKLRHGVQWPVAEDGTGTGRYHLSTRRARFFAEAWQPARASGDESLPFMMLSGPSLYHCGTLSTYAEGPLSVRPVPWLEIHPQDASRLGIHENDIVMVRSPQGEIVCRATFNNLLPEKVVFVPDHFREASPATLTAVSSTCRVQIQKKT